MGRFKFVVLRPEPHRPKLYEAVAFGERFVRYAPKAGRKPVRAAADLRELRLFLHIEM